MAEDAPIAAAIAGLQALHDLEAAKGRLLGLGAAAVPGLERYLREGAPEVLYEPRRAAVEVLAALGAREALLGYLGELRAIADPVARLAEEAVVNAAARAVARWRTPQVFDVLLGCTQRGASAGVIEALAAFRRPEAVAYYLQGLEDGLCEQAAAQALRELGREAEWPLLGAARNPLPSAAEERPTSLRRRRRALKLLAELGPSPSSWPWLRPLLDADDPELAIAAAGIAARLAEAPERGAAAQRLLELRPGTDWYLQDDLAAALRSLAPEAPAPAVAPRAAPKGTAGARRGWAARAVEGARRMLRPLARIGRIGRVGRGRLGARGGRGT